VSCVVDCVPDTCCKGREEDRRVEKRRMRRREKKRE
jgi:hypothetical protein